jgi:hypothetical protein
MCLLHAGGHGDENRGGKGGSWAIAASMVDGSEYQIVIVLDQRGRIGDRPTIATCLRQARRINYYFLLAEYRPLLHLL